MITESVITLASKNIVSYLRKFKREYDGVGKVSFGLVFNS